jgi:endonuclease YncB( thermonuclease family)
MPDVNKNSRKKYFNLIVFIILAIIIGLVTYLTFKPLPSQTQNSLNNNSKKEYSKREEQSYPNPRPVYQRSELPETEDEESSLGNSSDNLHLVSEVIDGDTFKLNTGEIIRLIGIDTPERNRPYFGQAKNYLKNIIEGKKVLLEKDISEYDKYNRLLRYIWLPLGDEDYLFVNLEIVFSGLAYAWTYPPDVRYAHELQEAQEEARQENRGLWK